MPDGWVERYLRLLQVDEEAPSLAALARLTRSQLLHVPFENITSLLRYRDQGSGVLLPLEPEQMLDRWERRAGGGVCYEVVSTFERLLHALGYQVWSVAGQISFPGSHQALVIALGSQQYLVDAGNGAPFFEPIPSDKTSEVHHAGLAYRFRPDDGALLQERLIAENWTPFCRYVLTPQQPAAFDAAYRRHHLPRESFVIGPPVVIRCTLDAVHALRGDELTHFSMGGKQVEQITDVDAYQQVAGDVFGLPALPIREALTFLRTLDGAIAA
ncbi:MAG: arylamine N-acetyltransferase [Herpetosiphonaceae bacterium]|nr:arylamine N-acetyltransferase [Herpetosiphonaceae bacterium]